MGFFKKDNEKKKDDVSVVETAVEETVESVVDDADVAAVGDASDEIATASEKSEQDDSSADVDEIMRKYDRESNTRIWEGTPKIVVSVLLAAFSVYCILMTLFTTAAQETRLSFFIAGVIFVGYMIYPANKKKVRKNHIPVIDIVLMVAGAGAFLYYGFNQEAINNLLGQLEPMHVVIAIVGVIVLVELCRRCVGLPIIVVAALLVAYFFWVRYSRNGDLLVTLTGITSKLFYSTQGILGVPVNACYNFIVMFIIFGAFLERTGIADFFISLANRIAGWSSGGAAKVAVISSALCGMVSGSSVGNTVTTGSVTIPMMKKTGYKPEFAGAVEAASSTGGQIMPPIMGAAAFLMAEYIGIPYIDIAAMAIVPAMLYFAGIFLTVHLEAKKLDLKGIPRDQLPKFSYLAMNSYLILPLVLLVYLVATGSRTMAFSAAISIIGAFLVGFINFTTQELKNREEGETVGECLLFALKTAGVATYEALQAGARNCVAVAIACAMAGIIAGCISGTGAASNLINGIVGFANSAEFMIGDYMFKIEPTIIGLVLTMLTCIVLGMGVPTTANYCIMAATTAPILIKLFVDPATGMTAMPSIVAAHFFVFYFGIVADITPPVALAAYAGSAIAKAKPMKTAVNAARLAIAAFIVPYILVYNPVMLFMGDDVTLAIQMAGSADPMLLTIPVWVQAIQVIVSSMFGLFGIAAALNGHLFVKINPFFRILLAAGGIMMMVPETVTDIAGIGIIVAIVVIQLLLSKRHKNDPAVAAA